MRVAVVIPIYKPLRADLDWYEIISLERCVEVLGHYPIRFIAPEGREFDYLPSTVDCKVETFDPIYFSNIHGYNALMLRPDFYERFLDYDYILIYQLDAFVFSDRLLEFCALGYDYIGAPWSVAVRIAQPPFPIVGNGGFSLRRTKACLDVLSAHSEIVRSLNKNEDFVLSYLGRMFPTQFKVAPVRTASQFSIEHSCEYYCRKNQNVLPFGCHAWHNLSRDFYIKVFSEFGYDLEPYAHLMKSCDVTGQEWNLRQLFTRRLINRIEHSRALRMYLSSEESFFIVLANDQSKILALRLYEEGLHVDNAHRIPILNDNLNTLQQVREILNHISHRGLLLSLTDDTNLVAQMISMGLKYGTQFISFWQEAKKYSTAMLRRISRPTVNRLNKR